MATKYWLGTTSGNFGTAANWSDNAAPANSDTLYITGANPITAGLSTGLTSINLYVDQSFSSYIGTSAGYLVIGCSTFVFAGTGTTASYIDLGSSAINAIVNGTPTGNTLTGTSGLYLKDSALTTLSVSSGYVGLATGLLTETSTVTTARVAGSNAYVVLGSGVTLTTAQLLAGNLWVNCAATTLTVQSGTAYTNGSGAITTVNNYGAILYPNSSGTVTTMNLYGGTTNFLTSPVARTVSTLNAHPGSSYYWDPNVLTITTKGNPQSAAKISVTAA